MFDYTIVLIKSNYVTIAYFSLKQISPRIFHRITVCGLVILLIVVIDAVECRLKDRTQWPRNIPIVRRLLIRAFLYLGLTIRYKIEFLLKVFATQNHIGEPWCSWGCSKIHFQIAPVGLEGFVPYLVSFGRPTRDCVHSHRFRCGS